MLHVSIFALFARSRSPLGTQLTPQGLNVADSPCELVVVSMHRTMPSPELPLLTFLWGSIFIQLMTLHRFGLTLDFFDPIPPQAQTMAIQN
jgi:hypothetical protein